MVELVARVCLVAGGGSCSKGLFSYRLKDGVENIRR